MTNIVKKQYLITGYLEFLLGTLLSRDENQNPLLEIITPKNPKQRGAQLSIIFSVSLEKVQKQLDERGIVVSVSSATHLSLTIESNRLSSFAVRHSHAECNANNTVCALHALCGRFQLCHHAQVDPLQLGLRLISSTQSLCPTGTRNSRPQSTARPCCSSWRANEPPACSRSSRCRSACCPTNSSSRSCRPRCH